MLAETGWRTSIMKWERLVPAIASGVLLACSGGSGLSEPGDTGNTGPTVAVVNNRFDPTPLAVPVNSTVTWVWGSGGVEHNVTFQTGPSSGNRTSGSFPRTFQSAGSFPYACSIHAAEGMSGVVNVTAGTGGTGDGGGGGDDGYGP
jgi:plastocyanin